MSLFDKNFAIFSGLGLQFGSSFWAKVLETSNSNQFNQVSGVGLEQVRYTDIALSGTSQIFAKQSNYLKSRVYFSNLIHSDRPCTGHEDHKDPDCHLNLLVQDLSVCCCQNVEESTVGNGYGAFILLGVVSPARLISLVNKRKPFLICCIYQSEDEWLSWACSEDLDSLMSEFKRLNVVFRARQGDRLRAELESLLFDDLLGFVGSALLVANVSDPRILRLVEGFDTSFLSGLRAKTGGPCVDEFLMLHHTRINCLRKGFALCKPPDISTIKPVIVIGSGPSLDKSLSVLKTLQRKCLLIAAGSSIGSLLRVGIRPHFHVHLERGYMGEVKSVYKNFLDRSNIENFGDIVGVMPTSIDPQLPELYKHVLMYARSGQSPVMAWPVLVDASLRYEGPECLSAAFSFAIQLNPKSLLLFGCDLGTASFDSSRSQGAVDHSARRFGLRVPGNLTPVVFSNSQMMLQASYMNAAYSVCEHKPDVRNFSDGMLLPFAGSSSLVDIGSLQSDPVVDYDYFDDFLKSISSSLVSLSESFLDLDVMTAGKQWLDQWIDLARRGESSPIALLRLQASRLLAERNSRQNELIYRIFRGSLRDGFWLTAFAVENLCKTPEEVASCWASFGRFLEALVLELEAMPSWLESS